MRGTGNKLEDSYIVPIARELAEALKAIHEAGIIHRDVKGKYEETHVAIKVIRRRPKGRTWA